ncbi:hypothetical protein Mgra_00009111 [Meloidogyne graminicola]|uniref:Uncharacterized protein n=1 Tax=Meloidogyne graminicola TaxID=189291 RepID=A0A8S9ZDU0_9BILA|nr:hypothetical protein Mgra_00009111 [Meloidogyne graminicola]
MGNVNQIPRLPIDNIFLTPGNVLIHVEGKFSKQRAQAMEKGEGYNRYYNLIRGSVARVPVVYQGGGLIGNFNPGDQVWVRGGKGFPIKDVDGTRYYVFHEWDIAVNLTQRR